MRKKKRPKHRELEGVQPGESSELKTAVGFTLRTIEARAKLYRNLVICVVIVGLLSILLPLILWSWYPLLGLLLLVPICGAFLVLDSRRVRRWQREILRLWHAEELDLDTFATTAKLYPLVPAQTLEGMLSALPMHGAGEDTYELSDEDKLEHITRLHTLARRQERRVLFGALSGTLVLCFLVALLVHRTVVLVACFAVSIIVWLLVNRIR